MSKAIKNKDCCWYNVNNAKRIGRCWYECSECGSDISFLWACYMSCMTETKDVGRAIKKLGHKSSRCSCAFFEDDPDCVQHGDK